MTNVAATDPSVDQSVNRQPRASALYDAALERLLHYGPEYGGGLASHGPMALDALASLGFEHLFAPFVDQYTDRLEPAGNEATIDGDWRLALAARLPELVAVGGSQAGHGLLRVAHAVRAIERSDNPVRRRELAAAMNYWSSGRPLVGPDQLTGPRSLSEVMAELPRLDEEPGGMLTRSLAHALRRPDVMALIASITPADDPAHRFDELALLAAEGMTVNRDISAFGLLHGVTVSTMARQLLPHLDEPAARVLEARVVAFVAAAVVGLDRSFTGTVEMPAPADGSDVDELVGRLAHRFDDHDIKFSEAAAGLHRRTGSPVVIDALRARLSADF